MRENISPSTVLTAKAAVTSSSKTRNISRKTLSSNSDKESSLPEQNNQQAGKIRANYTSNTFENALNPRLNCRGYLTAIPVSAVKSAALPERFPKSLTTIPKTRTSAENVLKRKKMAQHSVQLSAWVLAQRLMFYQITKKN